MLIELIQNIGVYGIVNLKNGKIYVGSASQSLKGRWKGHRNALRCGIHYNRHLQDAWDKYGEESFLFIVLEYCDPSVCLEVEQRWMDKYQASDRRYGYNSRPRAESNKDIQFSEETKAKMSEGARRRINKEGERERLAKVGRDAAADPEVRKKIAESRKGFKHSDDSKKRIRDYQKGRKKSLESIAKQIATRKANGYKMSDEQREKIRMAKLGKRLSDETKAKMSNSQKKRMEDPKSKEQLQEASNKRWADPSAREKQSEALKKAWMRRRGLA